MSITRQANPTQRATEVKEAVLDILARFPETRGNDKELMLRYWYEVDRLVLTIRSHSVSQQVLLVLRPLAVHVVQSKHKDYTFHGKKTLLVVVKVRRN
jgi:hypothetical protein